jgi:PST family polysaccharide transporter
LSTGFVFGGAVAQHRAMLQRAMRFGAIAAIELGSLVLSTTVGIAVAVNSGGYWALVVIAVVQPALAAVGTWFATRWVPGWPSREAGIKSLLMFGGTITLNNLIVYVAYNADKVLLGRFWGAEALGIYGRAYQLINVANESLLATVGLVAFPALSRLQQDPVRMRSYFVKGYGLFLSLIMPVTVCCAFFSEDIIVLMLGPKWRAAAPIFRWLAPTTMAFALTHPFSWLMLATGRAGRCLKIALVIAPVLIVGYAIGLSAGPIGVAAGFSIAMALAVVPVALWAKQGTLIRVKDLFGAVTRPALSVVIASIVTYAARNLLVSVQPLFARTVVECALLFTVYLVALLFVMGQLRMYTDLLRETGLWPGHGRAGESVHV